MDNIQPGEGSGRYDANAATPITANSPSSTIPASPLNQQRSSPSPATPTRPLRRRAPSIRIRRVPSSPSVTQVNAQTIDEDLSENDGEPPTRRRSLSAPQPFQPPTTPGLGPSGSIKRSSQHMAPVAEETSDPGPSAPQNLLVPPGRTIRRMRSASSAARSALGLQRTHTDSSTSAMPTLPEQEYDAEIVDLLDVVDPEVSTLSTLTNVQNSLFVPDLGSFLNRRPTYILTRRPTTISEAPTARKKEEEDNELTTFTTAQEKADQEDDMLQPERTRTRPQRSHSITSVLSESHYAVLPHGMSLTGWSEEDKEQLNDHVRHLLHSRRAKFKRGMKGFGQYVRRPLGFFVTLYATLITLFGLAWVLFLIGWVNVGGRKDYIINVIDNVLVALFAIIGDGLAPFRAVDTYHMSWIAHYHMKSWRLRREKALPTLHDPNDLPAQPVEDMDLEAKADPGAEFSVLNPLQQKRLTHHQTKFAKSHTFYKPHETPTHHAFPLSLLITVVVLLDCHSLLQIALGTCTWAISYHVRPFALTTVILCCSITCNATAGVVISIGDRKTRKKDVIEQMFRQELTKQAISKLESKKEKDKAKNGNEEEHGASQSE